MFVVKKQPPKRSSHTQWVTLISAMCLLAIVAWIAFHHDRKHIQDQHQSVSLPSPSTVKHAQLCDPATFQNHTDLDGFVVVAGDGPDPFADASAQVQSKTGGLHTRTAAECCQQCAETKGCNVFVWGQEQKQCWLKRADKVRPTSQTGSR